jgi:hypothetical protein
MASARESCAAILGHPGAAILARHHGALTVHIGFVTDRPVWCGDRRWWAWGLVVLLPLVGRAAPVSAGTPFTPSPNPTLLACTGNCDGNEAVSIDELLRGVNIALDQLALEVCGRFDADGNGRVTVNELVQGVSNALYGCGVTPPTPEPTGTPTATPTPTETPTVTSTAAASATPTATMVHTSTRTPSPTATTATSICGGPITSAPKLCSVEVVPNPVPLFREYRVRFCLSDREGDLSQRCQGIRTSPMDPILTCQPLAGTGQTINGCFELGPLTSTEPAGNYAFVLRIDDRLNNRAGPVEAPFSVR